MRAGFSVLYLVVMLPLVAGLSSLAVDWARVQLVKTQMQRAVDAAARAAVSQLYAGSTAAKNAAVAVASANSADGSSVVLNPGTDVTVGNWDTSAKVFTPNGTPNNAIRVTAGRTSLSGNGVPLTFAMMIGRYTCDVNVKAIALIDTTTTTNNVAGSSDPYLAGMPAGTIASRGGSGTPGDPYQQDTAPAQSPVSAGIGISGGTSLTFTSTGTVAYDPTYTMSGPDGAPENLTHAPGNEHGMSSITAPGDALIAVFLDDNSPEGQLAPSSLDFSTAASRDFTSLSPQLRQVFFIGDGQTSTGQTQQFIAPPGATRMFLATMDGFGWVDNIGSFQVSIKRQVVRLVK
jgi:Flp pilus assembly protein TadG